jgi:uncharacterized membrane protein
VGHDVPVRSPTSPSDEVYATREDPVAAASAEGLGGPAGTRIRRFGSWWTATRVLIVVALLVLAFAWLLKSPCYTSSGFSDNARYTRLCYSDIPYLYQLRGFANGYLPYIQTDPNGQILEYPVLTGAFMQIASWLTGDGGDAATRALRFYCWNVVLLGGCLMVAVACTAGVVRRRPWDALLFALAPAVLLCSFINWDLLAVALTAGFMLAWSRSRPWLAGVLLGLAIAAKFYPLLLLGPLLLVCWRTRQWPALGKTVVGTAIAWLLVNVPVYVANPTGWLRFYQFSSERGEDFGSPWYAFRLLTDHGVPADSLNLVATGSFIALCLGVVWLSWRAPTPPRLAQLGFLVIAAFCLTNKVYSPQYVLWLVPLAVLARPRWRDFLVWQTGEVAYFVAVWWYLEGYGQTDNKGLTSQWYAAATFLRMATTLYFAYFVCRDVLQPQHDPVPDDREVPDDSEAVDDDRSLEPANA